ncbi:MAG: DUF5615 family PIN-like protein [Verrucomicrobiota bacterium]|nr:DUF5615 family PIN-like protein [Verrucomicrobiota bacterium]
MSLAFYMDVHVPRAITIGLRTRGLDVLTAQEDDAENWQDVELLNRSMLLKRILFTQDSDFLQLAAQRQQNEEDFATIVYIHQLDIVVGSCIKKLELLAKSNLENINQVIFLPLKSE